MSFKYRKIKKFYSKRNDVYLIESGEYISGREGLCEGYLPDEIKSDIAGKGRTGCTDIESKSIKKVKGRKDDDNADFPGIKNKIGKDVSCDKGNRCVLKIFRGEDLEERKSKEEHFLREIRVSPLSVPGIIESKKDYLVIEYIRGRTLLDILTDLEAEDNNEDNPVPANTPDSLYGPEHIHHHGPDLQSFTGALDYIRRFNLYLKEVTGREMVLKDLNLRNFICGNNIARVDFEDCEDGQVEEDYGRFLAFILTYDPPFTRFKLSLLKRLINLLNNTFNADTASVKKHINNELLSIERRRGLEIPFSKVKSLALI